MYIASNMYLNLPDIAMKCVNSILMKLMPPNCHRKYKFKAYTDMLCVDKQRKSYTYVDHGNMEYVDSQGFRGTYLS